MSLATAAWNARVARRATAAAIAVALQGLFYFLVLHETIEKAVQPSSTPLEVTLIETPTRRRPAPLPRNRARPAPARPAPQRNPAALEVVPQPISSPQAAKPVAHAPVDWQRAIQGEVQEEESPPRPKKLDFSFPQAPQGPGARPQFGWDFAHTHRIVPLPHGGMIINISDRCSINLAFPIPMCQFGKQPANGHLFDNLEGSWNDRTDGLP